MLRGLIPIAALALVACVGGRARSLSIEAAIDGAGGSVGGTEYAPYFTTWGWGSAEHAFSGLADLDSKIGLRAVTLAFVLADGGCAASRDIDRHMRDVKAYRKRGGKVRASFGGAAGTYLESACASAPTLTEALSAFVDRTGIVDLDFDVEEPRAMTAAVDRLRAEALSALQKKRGVKIALTLPASPSGLSPAALSVVRASVAAGVVLSRVNVMTMAYPAPSALGRATRDLAMSDLAIAALTATKAQLQGVLPGLGDGEAWGMLGITPMIGDNGPGKLPLTLADAAVLTAFARRMRLGFVAFWAIQRDRPGPGPLSRTSRAQSAPFAFHKVFAAVVR